VSAMAWLAPKLVGRIPIAALANPPAIVELFTETVVEELDFRLEAENMLDIAHVLALTDQRTIVVPRPHPTLVTRRVLVLDPLRGFAFDDVKSMHEAGIDTEAVLRAGLVAFLEGAMLYGVFHGDLHGGNLFVQRDGRTALLDFGITGRLDEPKRLSFLRLLVTGTGGDVRGQLTALRDLGAFPPDTDVDAVFRDLKLDQPVKDPTTMSAEELIGELSDITQKLLGYGARIPKELMLFVKNLLFLNSATATLAPDIDILAQITQVYLYFAQRYVERIVHILGSKHGREEVRNWIKPIMAEFGEMYTAYEWHMCEPSGRVVVYMQNRRDNPDPNGPPIDFPGMTVLQYAGDGNFSLEEDFWSLVEGQRTMKEYEEACARHDP